MWEQLKRRSSYQTLPTVEPKRIDIIRDLHHPIFQNIRIVHVKQKRKKNQKKNWSNFVLFYVFQS